MWEWRVGVFLQSAIFASLECVARSVLNVLEEHCGVSVLFHGVHEVAEGCGNVVRNFVD